MVLIQFPCNPNLVEVGLDWVEVGLDVGLGCHNYIGSCRALLANELGNIKNSLRKEYIE